MRTAHDYTTIPAMVSHLADTEISFLALLCAVGEGEHAAVTAFITPTDASPQFRHAIEMEEHYSNTLLSFDHNRPPYYGARPIAINLHRVAAELGVDRVLCLVTQNASGSVNAVRDYDGLEVTLLEAANLQFKRFLEILDGLLAAHRRLQ